MGVTRTESHEDADEPRASDTAQTAQHPGAPDEQATTQLLIGSVGDRCANCGAPLASDQRYCVQCGERRGKSRFAAATAAGAPPQPPSTTRVTSTTEPPRRRGSYGTTLVAGIATLILAMGVGVEIGRIANSNNSSAAKAPQAITVEGGGGTGASTNSGSAASLGSTGSATHTGGHGKSKAAHHSAPPPKTEAAKAQKAAAAKKPTTQAVQKASHAASSVLGANGGQSNSTVTTGQSCQAGSAGCQNGHFSGNFFGG